MLKRADETFARRFRTISAQRLELGRTGWFVVVGVSAAVLGVIQYIAHLNGLTGPLTLLVTEIVGRPHSGEVKLAGLLLAVTCMPRDVRKPVLICAAVFEVVFNVERLIAGNRINFGNGCLIALLFAVGYALTRLSGREREMMLKATALGLLLVCMGRIADVWLQLTMISRPFVADEFVELADRALGSPAWFIGRFVEDDKIASFFLGRIYAYLALAAIFVACYQLRNTAREGFPRHHIVRTFLTIGLLGPVVYFVFPVVGPTYFFGNTVEGAGVADVWPWVLPTGTDPVSVWYAAAPRNCMPSLHTAWATTIFLHALRGPRSLKIFGAVFLVGTLLATLGFGFHYGVDLLAGAIFALTVETALMRPEDGWHSTRVAAVLTGLGLFTGLLWSVRYLSVEIAAHPMISAPLMISCVVVTALASWSVWRRSSVERKPTLQPA